MKLGIFMASGDSFQNMRSSGQDELFLNNYISYFSREFEEIYIFSYGKDDKVTLPKNVRVISNKYKINRFLYNFVLPLINYKYLKKCDIIRSYHLYGTMPAIVAKVIFNKPYIFNYAYDYEKFARLEGKYFNSRVLTLLKPIAVFFASRVFVANNKLLQTLASNKTIYLPNGTNVALFKPNLKSRKNNKKVIISVGRLEKQKNYDLLIKAVQGMRVKLLIIGNGSLRDALMSRANKLSVKLEIISKVPSSLMPKYYNQSDIFALVSKIEGHPKALLEAMASGLPSVATNVEGINDIVVNGVNGLLVRPREVEVRKALRKLLRQDSYSRKISIEARKSIVNFFNLNHLLKIEVDAIKK